MRIGFTTGSCAAAASKAAAYMLLFGKKKDNITIKTPKGIEYVAVIEDTERGKDYVSCGVRKDGGDDPDITTGAMIYSKVSDVTAQYHTRKLDSEDAVNTQKSDSEDAVNMQKSDGEDAVNMQVDGVTIIIDGGKGVGRVTKPGLDQPVGNAAINHVPREMIKKEVEEICEMVDFKGVLEIIISIPDGEALAQKTFNPRLGIVGGISVIGTSGIVEPMSTQAIIDTIRVELKQRKALGYDYVAVTPGNYGRDYMKRAYNYDLDSSVKCSNYIGKTLDMAVEMGFDGILLTGHIGKLVKLAGGIMNTHSKEGDCRMELMAAAAVREGAEIEAVSEILDCVVTEEGIRILKENGILEKVMNNLMDSIMKNINKRVDGKIQVECIMYSNEYGELAKSKGADRWLTLLAQEQEQKI